MAYFFNFLLSSLQQCEAFMPHFSDRVLTLFTEFLFYIFLTGLADYCLVCLHVFVLVLEAILHILQYQSAHSFLFTVVLIKQIAHIASNYNYAYHICNQF